MAVKGSTDEKGTSSEDDLSKPQRTARIFATVMICCVYFSRGLMFSIPGPTLLNLQQEAHTTVSGITYIFGARGVGLIVGCLFLGFVIKDRCRSAVFGVSCIGAAFAIGFAPWCTSLTQIVVAFATNGLGLGMVEAGGNYFLVKMWGDNSPAPIGAAVGGFILGATVSPLIALPFLGGEKKTPFDASHVSDNATATNVVDSIQDMIGDVADVISGGVMTDEPDFVRLQTKTLYMIVMGIACAAGIGLTCGSGLVSYTGEATAEETKKRSGKPILPHGWAKYVIICLMFLFVMALIGLELNFYGMVAAYIVLGLGGTEQQGTLMVSYFWGVYSIFSMIGTIGFNYLTPSTLLLINLFLITTANIVLVACPPTWLALWAGTTLLSIGFGSTYAGVFIWGDFYLHLSQDISAILVAGGQLGSVVIPIFTGKYFAADPFVLMKITLLSAVVCDVLFVAVEWIALPYTRIQRPCSLGLRSVPKPAYIDIDKLRKKKKKGDSEASSEDLGFYESGNSNVD